MIFKAVRSRSFTGKCFWPGPEKYFRSLSFPIISLYLCVCSVRPALGEVLSDTNSLELPPVGANQLRVISPVVLELTLVTSKKPDPVRAEQWDLVDGDGQCHLPAPDAFSVSAGERRFPVKAVGFRRRVIYAPLRPRDLRIGNYIYLELASPLPGGAAVEVKNLDHKLWPASMSFKTTVEPFRWSPAIHVNQTGYLPAFPKKAMVGYFIGNLGELDLNLTALNSDPAQTNLPPVGRIQHPASSIQHPVSGSIPFSLLEARSTNEVFSGTLTPRLDQGFAFSCYQRVFEADFSAFKTPGQYRLFVPGLGTSFQFFIDDGVAGAFARTYALGIYHQRCGTNTAMPITRFVHGPCHTAAAEVPDMSAKFAAVNESLAKETENYKDNPRHTAPQLKSVASCLYPFINRGPVDVHGGHHDAGDYSKYTINSASFVHHLVFAADAFPGVSALDNLGLPESRDGRSDILQEAKWEADFLARMQDADGGFYFLVYPHDREYEDNVTPDHGDPQIVFPKTTSVTAAATAALAQCASSPTFKKQFPEAAALYLDKARKGWAFLERAIAKYGKGGAYQKITHYGDEFMHDDEFAWAACELYLATGEASYHTNLLAWLTPADPATRRWGWWRMYETYGNAIRSYAFAARSGRLKREQLNPMLLDQCENEIASAGEDQLLRAQHSAYGTSFPDETKRTFSAGWYFSDDGAFDLAVALQLDYPKMRDPRPQMLDALISNINYEQGCNPVNVCYVTGLGWKRQRSIVHQWELNDRRVLPPTGIPIGNIQAGFGWNWVYQKELDALSFPYDGEHTAPYPFYDRWGDGWNVSQEFVILNQARALACLAWLMAQTPLKDQPWKPIAARISSTPDKSHKVLNLNLSLNLNPPPPPPTDLTSARIVWEADGQEPAFGQTYTVPGDVGWVEAEAQLPDGRRVFAALELHKAP
ncbi:MAG: glycoside hydrolase family 9 [Verrucomicrobia bacterium]|nr:MAG: glycoside hydrolase family 9 [Verrucomicrobiota bacterium]